MIGTGVGAGAATDVIAKLVCDQAAAIERIESAAIGPTLEALRLARAELRAGLLKWLQSEPGADERFTAQQMRVALKSIESGIATLTGAGEEIDDGLRGASSKLGALATKSIGNEIRKFSTAFGHSVTAPPIDTAAVIARGNRMLHPRFTSSAARYSKDVAADIRRQLAVGLVKNETFAQLTNRLRRLGGPRGLVALRGKLGDPDVVAEEIAEGLFNRYRHWADRIVRTEVMHAYNVQHAEGIDALNDEREDDEEGKFQRRWDASMDRACLICRALDGQVADVGKPFPGGVMHPPAHPYCRCVETAWHSSWGTMKGERKPPVSKKPPPRKRRAAADRKPKAPAKPKAVRAPKPKATPSAPRDVASVHSALERGDLVGAQAGVRKVLENAGYHPTTLPPGHTRAPVPLLISDHGLVTKNHSGEEIKADAIRHWDGMTQLSREAAAGMRGLKGKGVVDDLRRDPDEMYREKWALDDRVIKLRVESRTPEARAAAQPEIQRLIAESDAIGARIQGRKSAVHSLETLVHEEIHGYSPANSTAYVRSGGKIEEVTTETLARTVMRDRFGVKDMPGWDDGAYQRDIGATTRAISETAGISMDASFDKLREVSHRYRMRVDKLTDEHQVMVAFCDDVAATVGVPAADFRRKLEELYAK